MGVASDPHSQAHLAIRPQVHGAQSRAREAGNLHVPLLSSPTLLQKQPAGAEHGCTLRGVGAWSRGLQVWSEPSGGGGRETPWAVGLGGRGL